MKVFVSWSGKVSREVALALKEWLPLVIQSIEPYVSSEDIQKGARWSSEIEKALSDSRFGIICLTEDNLIAPWVHFEAGALSKAIENSQVNVCPFLFNVRQASVEGPLSQFQSVRNERKEILKLVSDINLAAKSEHERVKPKILEQSFQAFWPELEEKLKNIADGSSAVPAPKRNFDDVLEEILETGSLSKPPDCVKTEPAGFNEMAGSETGSTSYVPVTQSKLSRRHRSRDIRSFFCPKRICLARFWRPVSNQQPLGPAGPRGKYNGCRRS